MMKTEIINLIPMSKRINIVLPETTIQTIDRMVKPGQRSRFINQAVEHFVANRSTEALRAQLERAAVRDQDLDREVAADWFAVDQESWQRLNTAEQQQKPAIRDGEKSTSRRSTRR
jgi:CopG family transcriptional regulator / antitoxin EndoAI